MLELRGATYRYAGYATAGRSTTSTSTLADGEIVGAGRRQRGRASRRSAWSRPGSRRPRSAASLSGTLADRRRADMAGRPVHELCRSGSSIGFQNPTTQRSGVAATVFEEVALGPMNLGLPVAETVDRATASAGGASRIEHLADRDPPRLSGGQAQLVAIASLLAMRPRPRRPRRADRPARPGGDAARRRGAPAASPRPARRSSSPSTRRTCSTGCAAGSWSSTAGRIVARRPDGDDLRRPAAASCGVEPPARVRLARARSRPGAGGRGSRPARRVAR